MLIRFTVKTVPGVQGSPMALVAVDRLAYDIWAALPDTNNVRMKRGRRMDPETYEFIWESGENTIEGLKDLLSVPDSIEAVTDPSIIAAVGRTIAGTSDSEVPF